MRNYKLKWKLGFGRGKDNPSTHLLTPQLKGGAWKGVAYSTEWLFRRKEEPSILIYFVTLKWILMTHAQQTGARCTYNVCDDSAVNILALSSKL